VDGDVPLQTNKFYANFFLGSQGFPVWTHPYSLSWAKGTGNSYGMAISHTERSQFAFGPDPSSPQYFISPIGIQHMVLSAAELGSDTVLSVENLKAFSVYANLAPSTTSRVLMSFPCVQGMGFVTAIYDRAQPVITSGVFFRTLDYIELVNDATHKYRIQLNDGSSWILYATSVGSVGTVPFNLTSSSTITGPVGFTGMIQVTKNPAGAEGEQSFDSSAGAYPINATISGSVDGSSGSYTLSWAKGGVRDRPLLMYALPHHVESFDQETRAGLKNIKLVTTTKGYAQAVVADRFTMIEDDLPDTIGFAPWAKAANGAAGGSENVNLNAQALALINEAGIQELSQDMDRQTRLNSMYYSGKGLAKFATICYTLNSMTGNSQYAAAGLTRLKDAFNVFVNNTQPEPLVYDQVWKGIVSSATYKPPYDTGLDFGNTLYNDHHFHYGYFVYTAAVIGHLDPSWLDEGSNKAWVNTLVKDFANPVTDEYYPFQRAFDWFHGHSWAKGLFESGDGKDQESTSEDTFATYALKMWGKISLDPNMEARGNLQLAVQARSMRNYFLLTSDNKNQPESFLHNKVTGILFENKIDHTTYFGTNIEYIQGIHMIPLNPSSAYTRSKQFVQEEWDTYFSNGRVDQVQGGWKGILYANLALIDPQRSYDFFADPNFNTDLDGGASRTWYLAYSAAMLGANSVNAAQDPDLDFSSIAQTEPALTPISNWNTSSVSASPTAASTWPRGFDWPKPTSSAIDEDLESQNDDSESPTTSGVSYDVKTENSESAESVVDNEDASSKDNSPDMDWGLQDKQDDNLSSEVDYEQTQTWDYGGSNPNDYQDDDEDWEYEVECNDNDNVD
jgi:endo-1,3(4)-beta-glucanase